MAPLQVKSQLIGRPIESIVPAYSLGFNADCEWKAQAGNICVASFDWSCSGICRSVDRIKEVHRRCGEGEDAVWKAAF